MGRNEAMTRIEQALGQRLLHAEEKSDKRVFLEVAPDTVTEISRLMFEELGARLQTASGVDTPAAIEVLYHWALDRSGCVITVRTRLNRENPEVDSITSVLAAAEWVEREMWELLGIRIRNHPDLRHLLLSDDWPEGKYPLRRDFEQG
jgi:NADH:ubiquinone oxidoreductase subunit C